ncbi:MAG: FFLEELY motif protein [Gammaproteobacteria bacterium]
MMAPTTQGTAQQIRDCLAEVEHLRRLPADSDLQLAMIAVKQLQARRFSHTYADYLADPGHAPAARFFLDELYGARDFSERDAQFGRIAGAIERLFPDAVGALAVDLARTHALTERMDHALATHWVQMPGDLSPSLRYVKAWRLAGQPLARERQLDVTMHMGRELQRLTRILSLRMALRMMRKPAAAAGLSSLQHFLEMGFDAFAGMKDADAFLASIHQRETFWIRQLFDDPEQEAARSLSLALA